MTGVSAAVLALMGGFSGAAAASSAARLLLFAGCGAALLRFRRGTDLPPTRFRLSGGGAVASVVIVSCLALLASALRELAHLSVVAVTGALP